MFISFAFYVAVYLNSKPDVTKENCTQKKYNY